MQRLNHLNLILLNRTETLMSVVKQIIFVSLLHVRAARRLSALKRCQAEGKFKLRNTQALKDPS